MTSFSPAGRRNDNGLFNLTAESSDSASSKPAKPSPATKSRRIQRRMHWSPLPTSCPAIKGMQSCTPPVSDPATMHMYPSLQPSPPHVSMQPSPPRAQSIHAPIPTSGSMYPCTNPHLGLDACVCDVPERLLEHAASEVAAGEGGGRPEGKPSHPTRWTGTGLQQHPSVDT